MEGERNLEKRKREGRRRRRRMGVDVYFEIRKKGGGRRGEKKV